MSDIGQRCGENLIDHPAHYIANGVESIDVIEAFSLGFHLGNVIKYVLRANRKGAALSDLKKAQWYLTREIENTTRALLAPPAEPKAPKDTPDGE